MSFLNSQIAKEEEEQAKMELELSKDEEIAKLKAEYALLQLRNQVLELLLEKYAGMIVGNEVTLMVLRANNQMANRNG